MSAMQGALSAAERSMRSVFVGNIPYEATEEQLKDIFAEVGPVVSFRLVYDRETGKPKGYGFCEYKDQEMALSAMRNLNSYELNGRALRVDNAASEKSKEELKNLQASLGGPPVESPYGPEVQADKAPEVISKIICSLPPEQLCDLMMQMKQCIENNPNEARTLLIQNPQLTYALLQAQVMMKLVDPETAKTMLHTPGYLPPAPAGPLLPTPEAKTTNASAPPICPPPPIVNEVPTSYPGVMPVAPMNPVQQNAGMANIRPTQPVVPLHRPALLGERPPLIQERPPQAPPANQMLRGPFPERTRFPQPRMPMPTGPQQNKTGWTESSDSRSLGDHDLRQMPMPDRDMRAPPVLGGDKDMRQPVSDEDLRTHGMPGGMPENRSFDPRYRNMPPADNRNMQPMDGHGGPSYDRSRPMASSYEGRPGPAVPPAHSDAHNSPAVTGNASIRGPQNPRITAVGGASPAVSSGSPNPNASPRPANSLAAAAAAIAPHDQEKAALIMQVLQLSDRQIAMLPPEQRQSIMILKEQIARSQVS